MKRVDYSGAEYTAQELADSARLGRQWAEQAISELESMDHVNCFQDVFGGPTEEELEHLLFKAEEARAAALYLLDNTTSLWEGLKNLKKWNLMEEA